MFWGPAEWRSMSMMALGQKVVNSVRKPGVPGNMGKLRTRCVHIRQLLMALISFVILAIIAKLNKLFGKLLDSASWRTVPCNSFLKVGSSWYRFQVTKQHNCYNTETEYAEFRVIYKVLSRYDTGLWFLFQSDITHVFTVLLKGLFHVICKNLEKGEVLSSFLGEKCCNTKILDPKWLKTVAIKNCFIIFSYGPCWTKCVNMVRTAIPLGISPSLRGISHKCRVLAGWGIVTYFQIHPGHISSIINRIAVIDSAKGKKGS